MTLASNIFIGLGSNIGDRAANLKMAREEIEKKEIAIVQTSAIYESKAWGCNDQAPFLNQVIEISTLLPPAQLLHRLKEIEITIGRQKRKKWREREIDLDILYYEDQIVKREDLRIPHPYIRKRRFVLTPLDEISGDYTDPETNETIHEILQCCADEGKVETHNPSR